MVAKLKRRLEESMPEQSKLPVRSRILGYTAFFIFVLVITLIIIYLREQAKLKLHTVTEAQAVQLVAVLVIKPGPASEEVVLPANVQAWHDASIFARSNGYVKQWYVDIGSRVKKGDLLAELEAPEVNQQLQQAEADLNTAIANETLAAITAKRWLNLLKTHSVSKQETDEKVSNEKATRALVNAARANRDRLRYLVSFQRVVAPFDGVISYRNTDIGALINAGSGSNVYELFRIVQSNPLRIYVQIPQIYTSNIKPDMTVTLRFPEYPGRTFPAKLLQTADAISVATRTLLAQFMTDNAKGELLPGSYTEMHFDMPLSQKLIRIPVNTLIFRSKGLQVGTVDSNDRVVLKSITISRDFGKEVEVNSGLQAGERVILNPPDSIFNGQKVRVVPEKQKGLT
jgi:RND family efflux transporter MFP subunit